MLGGFGFGVLFMNELQKVIIQSIINNNDRFEGYYNDMRETFPINTLCELLEINRNKYYYLVETGKLHVYLHRLYIKVGELK